MWQPVMSCFPASVISASTWPRVGQAALIRDLSAHRAGFHSLPLPVASTGVGPYSPRRDRKHFSFPIFYRSHKIDQVYSRDL